MGSQSIEIDSTLAILNTFDKEIVEDVTTLMKKLRFEIGEGISKEVQFNTLFVREIICNNVCGLEKEEYKKLIDKIHSGSILSKKEYL